MKKRFLSLLLAAAMCLGLVGPVSAAETGDSAGGVTIDTTALARGIEPANDAAPAGEITWTGDEWNSSAADFSNVESLHIGREDAHTSFFPFKTEADALASQQVGQDRDLTKALYQPLNTAAGNTWKFYHVNYPYARKNRPDNDNIMNPDYDDSVAGWDEIKVPSTWELTYNEDKTFKYNPPHYSNTDYAWWSQTPNPTRPNAPTQFNPVGFYRTKFTLDDALKSKNVFLNFDGVESAFYVWVNGHKVGYSTDSFTSKEFKIDQYLVEGENTLAVEVFKWSSGSWLEDQDMLRLSGIFRSVYLTAKEDVEIRDFTIVLTHAGAGSDPATDFEDFNLDVYVNLRDLGAASAEKTGLTVDVSLYDAQGNKLGGDAFETNNLSAVVDEEDFRYFDSLGRPTSVVSLSAKVLSPEKWTAETPNLYKALITLRNSAGEIVETTAYRIGFRDLAIVDQGTDHAKVLLNGQPLLIKGVNTQEIHPTEGRALSSDTIRWDLTAMKQNNFNAVRMSHYSHDFRYYDIADELGLYVMEEANLECHGATAISGEAAFKTAFLDRVSSMYYRSKNYPSVIMLSLGNEAGGGSNHQETANWLNGIYEGTPSFYQQGMEKGDLQDRPIHYEGNSSVADLKSNMYPKVVQLQDASDSATQPYILCEYAHSLGNAMGYYQDYWDAFDRNENMIGGFIWDWVDQGVLTYQAPDSFPPQLEAGANTEFISVSQDDNRIQTKLTAGFDTLDQPGATNEAGDKGLKGVAIAETNPEALNINGSITVEADIFPTVPSNGSAPKVIMAKGDHQYNLRAWDNKIDFTVVYENKWNSVSYEYPLDEYMNQWHHVAATYDVSTKTINIYYDDMSVAVKTQKIDDSKLNEDGTYGKNDKLFCIGRNSENEQRDWVGLIDNARVYNRALTAEELASNKRTAADEGVVLWDDFNSIGETGEKFYLVSQDGNEIRTRLENGTDALKKAGHTGEAGDKSLTGAAVAQKRPKALNINGSLTMEAWVNPKAGATGQLPIFAKGDTTYQLKYNEQAKSIQFDLYASGWDSLLYKLTEEELANWADTWHQVAVTYNQDTKRASIYYEDMTTPKVTKEMSTYADGTFSVTNDSFAVGRNTSKGSGSDWSGLIDDAHVYNIALTGEVLANMDRTSADAGVVYWEDFNGETTTDPGPDLKPEIIEEGYWGFGGDWGDQPNSNNFCANGIVSPDRVLRGSVLEAKRVHQDYVMDLESATTSSALINIRSRALFTDASAYDFVWELKEDGVAIRGGTQSVSLAPLASGRFTIDFEEVTPSAEKEYLIIGKFQLKNDTLWADAGWEISAAQFDLNFESTPVPATDINGMPDLTYTETDDAYVVTGQDFTITFGRAAGSIISFLYRGTELFSQGGEDANGPTPNFWRAPTDNDRSSLGNGNINATVTAWRYAGRDRTDVTTSLAAILPGDAGKAKAVKISVGGDLAVAPNEKLHIGTATYDMVFTIYANGQVEVENTMTPSGFGYMNNPDRPDEASWERNKHIVPAVGNLLQLPAEFENLTWFGQGSDAEGIISESYKGREEQQFVDVFSGKVSEQADRYNKPQTTGNKMGVRWVALTNDAGLGLMASAISENLQINAQHKTPEMLTTLGSNHPYEVAPMDDIALTLDNRQLGVGYDPGYLSDELYHGHLEDIPRPYQPFVYSYKLVPVEGFTPAKGFELSRETFENVPPVVEPHAVNISDTITGGTVTASPASAVKDTEITLTVTSNDGYELETLTVTKTDDATAVTVTDNKFTMPDCAVTVTATFKKTADQTDLETAKGLVEGKSYTVAQATANTEDDVAAWLDATIADLSGMAATGVAAEVEITAFTAATAGESETPAGEAGSFTFTVTLSKNAGSITVEKSGAITATAYVAPGVTAAPAFADITAAFSSEEATTVTFTLTSVPVATYTVYDAETEGQALTDPAWSVEGSALTLTFTAQPDGEKTYYISATDTEGERTESARTAVTVEPYIAPEIPVERVTLDVNKKTLTVGETFQLTATVEPEDAADKSVTWVSSDETVATVDASGLVSALSGGTAIITVTTVDGKFTAECSVTVETYEEPHYNPPSNTTTTEKNGDGSTTRTVTNKKTGNVTETTTYPDGTKIVATTPKDGETTIEVTVPKDKETVIVTIPTATEPKPGEVAVVVKEDGSKEILKTSIATEDGMRVLLSESCKLEIMDNSRSFTDVASDHWAADAVQFAASRELFTGTGADTFSPAAGMTRGMLMTVLARLDGQDTILGDTWYSAGMEWAKEQGISDGSAPEAEITRESLAVMLYRYAGNPEVDESRRVKDAAPYGEFADVDSVSGWARDAMLWAVESGIITGSGNKLNPGGTATRAEVAAMLQRFISKAQ